MTMNTVDMQNSFKPKFTDRLRNSSQTLLLLGVAIAFFVVSFAVSSSKLFSLIHIASFLAMAALGQSLVFLIAGIDLSVSSVISGAAILTCSLLKAGFPLGLSVLIVIIACAVVGVINGIGIVKFNIPPLVMTVAMQRILQGVILIITNGRPAAISTDALGNIVNNALIGPLSGAVVIMIVCIVLLSWMLYKTKLGREIYMLGSNMKVARLSGVNINAVTIKVYTIAAVLTGITGIMLLGYTGTAAVRIGESYLLPSIAAVLLGGTSPLGGKGDVIKTFLGAFILTNIVSLLTVVQISESIRQIIEGLIVLFFVIINNFNLQLKTVKKQSKTVNHEA
jgi:ribose transport system permease protein